jgi:hypothetical protein
MNSAVAAIQFALEDEDGLEFLRFWHQGDFDVLRQSWPNAPEAVYIGADPEHPMTPSVLDSEMDATRLEKLLQCCTKAQAKFYGGNEIKGITLTIKASVETSPGFQTELRKMIDEMRPIRLGDQVDSDTGKDASTNE